MGKPIDKGIALLYFLKDAATLRRKRVASYGAGDKLIWLADVPKDRLECRSEFLLRSEMGDLWLEVRKKRMPTRPPVPEEITDWIRASDLDQPDEDPELLPEITVLVERRVPDPDAPSGSGNTVVEKFPELRRLNEHTGVQDVWLEYIVDEWKPWAKEMRRWQEVQRIYEDLDFMRRRLEESEERYELLLGVGLLQWHDSTGATIRRHLLTAPAEISLDAARGILTAVPAASFEGFRIEFDMLEFQDQPRLNNAGLNDQLDELDTRAWDTAQVGQILLEIANRIRPDAQVDETAFRPVEHSDGTLRVTYAPAFVLRERRPTGYENLVNGFLKIANDDASSAHTAPWRRLLQEGESAADLAESSEAELEDGQPAALQSVRYLFPLPSNEEQRQIVHRYQVHPYVLVKGPPGTGKSHTIANLICHLLASGNRILVTAHAPKALAVLRGLMPDDIRDLCVTALGSSREDQRLLEESVRGVLRRKNEWRGTIWAQGTITQTEADLQRLEGDLAIVERRLRECREAETHSHTLRGGYEGTAAQIARRFDQERETFRWFPEIDLDETPFPLEPSDLNFLIEVHGQLTQEKLEGLRFEIGDAELPDPDSFKRLVSDFLSAEQAAERAATTAAAEKIEILRNKAPEALERFQSSLLGMEEHTVRGARVLGGLIEEILGDLLAGNSARWARLAGDVAPLLDRAATLRRQLGTTLIEVRSDLNRDCLRAAAERRRDHFEKGGRRGFSFFAPRLVRETRLIEDLCFVDGKRPREVKLLTKLVIFFQLEAIIHEFKRRWPAPMAEVSDPGQASVAAAELASELTRLITFFENLETAALDCVPVFDRPTLVGHNERSAWLKAIAAEYARRRRHSSKASLEECLRMVRRCQMANSSTHQCLYKLAEAASNYNIEGWRVAWEEREQVQGEKERFKRYEALVETLELSCPGLGKVLRDSAGNPEWKCRLLELEKAWTWACAGAWVRRVSDATANRDLVQDFHRLMEKIEKTTEKLAALMAWRWFFERLDNVTVQSLNAWTKAVDRIGKGTGKHAYRHRRAARKYLMDCVPKIPAWVMPLHKLWDTVNAEPGLFDTIIVDEASQAGIESLALLPLAKRIIIVGDDKQNSPEAVGVLEDDIVRLAGQHLTQFRFREEFRPNSSLYDHAERAFGVPISLREHFRCVPEIIRFSNDLCYQDAPLIPLRQAPPNRLPPLKSTYVPEGACDGEGQRICNRAEADALVKVIQSVVEDPAYEGKTMGVIALQGHSQAELIERQLAQSVDPRKMADRRLRCGEPATFQGDERDVIFLSMVIAPNVHYRAIGRLPDVRRFNVAMSRAKDQVWLFHSVQQHDLSRECLRKRLLRFFENPERERLDQISENLIHLEQKARGVRRQGNQPEPYESWFEVDVALELLRRKYAVRPQVKVTHKRIDLVVDGLDARLAVECDGDEWHGPEEYDSDMSRQRQFERAGWTFVRVRESEFYADRLSAINAIIDACDMLGIYPLDRIEVTHEQAAVLKPSVTLASEPDDIDSIIELRSAEKEAPEENALNADSWPSSGYKDASGFVDPREASLANVRTVLRQIIESHGPLPRASTYRLYVTGCPSLHRVGKVVRQALNRALGTMLRAGEIIQEDELGKGFAEGQVLRLAGTERVQVRPAGNRDLFDIPPSELLVVLDRLFPTGTSATDDDETLLRSVFDHYGFYRLTRSRREYLAKVLGLYRSRKEEPENTKKANNVDNVKASGGEMPQSQAEVCSQKDAVGPLFYKNAEVNARDDKGWTPLHRAAACGNKDLAELLIARDADVNAKTKDGLTPLHCASKDVAELLIAKGADVNDMTNDGWTPLHWAAFDGHKDKAEWLISKGANVNAKIPGRLTPLDCAKGHDHWEVVELLKKHGAK